MKISEREWIERTLIPMSKRSVEGLICGIGDDCAVIEGGGDDFFLISTDALCEGVHFDLGFTDFFSLGSKAISVNLSDIAAMGGTPKYYLVALSIPNKIQKVDLKRFYKGMKYIADEFGVELIGGDTTSSRSGFFINITVVGTGKKGEVIFRNGAELGDRIFVAGNLGHSALGLELLMKKKRSPKKYIEAHNLPKPLIEFGIFLSGTGLVNSMIDLSDGLMIDLDRVASLSSVGYRVYLNSIPVEADFKRLADSMGLKAFDLKLSGGEDYAILFTVSPKNVDKFKDQLDNTHGLKDTVYEIGEIVESSEKMVVDEKGGEYKIGKMGFDHFK